VFYLSMISAVKQANWFHISADVHATLWGSVCIIVLNIPLASPLCARPTLPSVSCVLYFSFLPPSCYFLLSSFFAFILVIPFSLFIF
jgi:hypothetical protein